MINSPKFTPGQHFAVWPYRFIAEHFVNMQFNAPRTVRVMIERVVLDMERGAGPYNRYYYTMIGPEQRPWICDGEWLERRGRLIGGDDDATALP